MSDRYKKLLELSMSEDRINKILEAMPERPLKPGQSARITGKDNQELVKNIRQYISTHKSDINKLDRLEHQLNYYEDFGLTPAQIEHLKQEIANLKKFRDPKTHGYEKIIDQIVPIIKQRCSKYLPSLLASRFFLYRGMGPNEHKNRLAFRAHSRDNRKPLNSNVEANAKFNLAMEELGLKATRENSIFCTSSEVMTGIFGTTYVLFPCNGSHYTWSETISDLVVTPGELYDYAGTDDIRKKLQAKAQNLVNQSDKLHEQSTDNKIKIFYQNIGFDLNPVNLFNDMKNYETHIHVLDRRLAHGREVEASTEFMDEVEFLISDISKLGNEIEDCSFEIDMEKFQNHYALRGDERLESAISAEREILVNGEYICVIGSLANKIKEELLVGNKDVTEATKLVPIKKSPDSKNMNTGKPPVLKPGATADIPKFSKFGEIIQKLHEIKAHIVRLKATSSAYDKLEKSQTKMQSNLKVDQLVDYINKHCGLYVKEMQKADRLLYRGIKSNESKDRYAFIGNSRANRRPRDSNAVAAKEFDKILSRLGFEALRKNSIFTTSNMAGTLHYGTRYIIFPLDSAKFTYTDHRDVVLNTGSEHKWFTFSFKDKKQEAHIMKTLSEILVEVENYTRKLWNSDNYVDLMPIIYHYSDLIFSLVTIQNTKRFQSLRSAYQQALNIPDIATNEHYRIFNKFKEFIAPYMPKLKKSYDLERFKEIYNPQNTDLSEAIDRGVEIYISGHYLALRAIQFETIIKEKILGKKYE